MRIGIVTTWFERGAAYVSKQYEEAISQDHEVFIYARGGEMYAIGNSNWDKKNVTWGKRKLWYRPTEIDIGHFREWVKINKIEIVLFNEQHEWEPVLECENLGVISGAYIDYYKNETVELFGLYDFLFTNTKRHQSVFEWHPQSYYIPWGTNTKLFKPKRKPKKYKDYIVFFHSSGMNPYRKGTDYVLEAFSNIDRKKSKLLIHSQVNLSSFFPDKAELIEKLINEESLEVITETVTAPGLYYMADIYVYPSRLEGIGLTIAEAISSGLPTITTDEPPMSEFISKNISGKLIQVASKQYRNDNYYWPECTIEIESLEEQMKFYISKINELEHLKDCAREYATNNLDWNKNFKENFDNIKIKKIVKSIELRDLAILRDRVSFKFRIKKSLIYRMLKAYFKDIIYK